VSHMSQPDTIGTTEAAEILGWSTTKVKMQAQAGELPTLTKMRGQTGAYLFSRAVIVQLANQAAA
jgi:hypothetical protein